MKTKIREENYERMKEKLLGELKKTFRPEFLNRIDGVMVFHSLTRENIRKIVDLIMVSVTKQLAEKGIKLEVTDAAKDFLGEKGYDEVFGARPLRRVIQDRVEDKLSEELLREKFQYGDTVVVDVEAGEIVLTDLGRHFGRPGQFDLKPAKEFKGGTSLKYRLFLFELRKWDSGLTVLPTSSIAMFGVLELSSRVKPRKIGGKLRCLFSVSSWE